jgi:N-methylhydantoinase B
MRLVKPVFWDGELIALLTNCGHWSDVGGAMPGSFYPGANDAFAEGVRVPVVKVFSEEGGLNQAVVDVVMANVRTPHESIGDFHAQLASVNAGEKRLKELIETYGAETIKAAYDRVINHSEALLRRYLEERPDGEAEFEDFIDFDPAEPDSGPIKVHLKLTKKGGHFVFDFTDSDPQPRGAVGGSYATTCSAVYNTVMNLFPIPGLAMNHGVIRVCEVRTTPGSVVHVTFPAPVSGMCAGTFEKVMTTIIGAVGKLMPDKRIGCPFNDSNMAFGGLDPRFNRPYVMYEYMEGGYGGGPHQDGGNIPSLPVFGGGSTNAPVEVCERFYPVRFHSVSMIQDSAGGGQWRGGPGSERVFELTDGEARLTVIGDREIHPPWGCYGGLYGLAQGVVINHGKPGERHVGMHASNVKLAAGDVIYYWSGGGGGFGNPKERDPERVLVDVIEGFVSPEAARDIYGVALKAMGDLEKPYEIDYEATCQLRAQWLHTA